MMVIREVKKTDLRGCLMNFKINIYDGLLIKREMHESKFHNLLVHHFPIYLSRLFRCTKDAHQRNKGSHHLRSEIRQSLRSWRQIDDVILLKVLDIIVVHVKLGQELMFLALIVLEAQRTMWRVFFFLNMHNNISILLKVWGKSCDIYFAFYHFGLILFGSLDNSFGWNHGNEFLPFFLWHAQFVGS